MHDRNPQARQIALSNLLGHTQNDAPSRSIFFKGLQGSGLGKQPESEVVRDLKLLCRDQLVNPSQRSLVLPEPHRGFSIQAIAHDAFKALVNLSDSPVMISALSDSGFLQFLVSYILVGICIAGSWESLLGYQAYGHFLESTSDAS